SRREPEGRYDSDCKRGTEPGQGRRDRVRPQPAGDVRVRQLLTPVQGSHAVPKPGTRKGEIALIGCAYQRRHDRAVSSGGLVRMGDPVVERCVSVHAWRRIDTM